MRMIIAAVLLVLAAGATTFGAQDSRRPAASKAPALAGVPVNLNTATAAQLESLPGVGAALAQRILDYRQSSGGFKKVEELMNVRGIGEASFLKLKALLTLTPPKTDRAAVQ